MTKTKSLPASARTEHLTMNDLALALAGVRHAQSWWREQKGSYARCEVIKFCMLNTKLSAILDKFSLPRNEGDEIRDNGEDVVTLLWERYAP